MEGIGPNQLKTESLISKVEAGGVSEVIFALSATMEGIQQPIIYTRN